MNTPMKQINKSICLAILIFFSSCSQKENNYETDNVVMETAADASYESTDPANKKSAVDEANQTTEANREAIERKLIKNGAIAFETYDIDSTRTTIVDAVKKYGGYVSSDKNYKSTNQNSQTIVVRIPTQHFDDFLAAATQNVQQLDSKDIYVEDVTEEFLDIEARIKTKKELEQRYIALLEKANTVTEILEIESQIGALRAEIESIEGRLKYLQDQVSMSTLTITFYEVMSNENQFAQDFKEGFKQGWDNFIWFFMALTNIWPFIFLGFGLIGLLIFRVKRKQKNQ